jgi:hypothetical protein
MLIRTVLLTCAVATAVVSPASAQIKLNADLLLGGGARTSNVDGLYFKSSKSPFGQIALTAALPAIGRVRPVITVDRSGSTAVGDHIDVCEPAPNGTCLADFPGLTGYSVGGGFRAAVSLRMDVGISAGAGHVSGGSKYADADIALALSKHWRAVGQVRQLIVYNSSGHRLWWRPLSAGLRIQ